MSSPRNPISRGSRGSLPHLVFDVRPCRLAQLAWTLFAFPAAATLCFTFAPHPAWRVIAPIVALGFAWLPGLAVLCVKGPLAVRQVEWAPGGEWRLTLPSGRKEAGRLAGATATLGPWILLAWTVTSGRRVWSPFGRRYALIGVTEVGPEAFRALKGRLALLGRRHYAADRPVQEPVAP